MARTLKHAIDRLASDERRGKVVDVLDHDEALKRRNWSDIDVVLVDSYFGDRQRRNPTASLFAGLEVAEHLASQPKPPRIVAYSQLAEIPEIKVPFSEVTAVVALYGDNELLGALQEAIWSNYPEHQIGAPSPADYAALGIGPRATITTALAKMKSRPDAWELVARTRAYQAPEARTRDFVNLHVRPLLDIEQPGYRAAVHVLQRITHLPVLRPR